MKEFSYDEYQSLLVTLLKKYRVIPFPKMLQFHNEVHPETLRAVAVIRHDVDLDLARAVKLAQIEAECNVSATYCIMVTSDAYNILSEESQKHIQALVDLGHDIGLHFSPLDYGLKGLKSQLRNDARVLESRLGPKLEENIEVVSHHNYGKLPVGFKVSSALIDTYEEPFMSHVKYFADSYGAWRFGHPLESDAFKSSMPLHLNFHPFWWGSDAKSQLLALLEFTKERDGMLKWYIAKNCLGF